jgi:3-oxoacyl-[acyl-carrier protein] reductase
MAIHSELSGKICLVTGAARKLGAAICRIMARNGVHLAVNYTHSRSEAEALCSELAASGVRALAIQADVTDPEQVDRLVNQAWEALGPIDILVNNVGTYADTPFLQLEPSTFAKVMDSNVGSTYLVSRAAGRRMKQRGMGVVINVGAADAMHHSHSVYGLAKLGVSYLTRALALELAPQVRVNAVAPDLISDNEDLDPASGFSRASVAATPMNRLVRRAEIARIVALLCTESFDFVTGQVLGIDGGRSISRIACGPSG